MKHRIASVDIFRALTMLLMIFVNDLWTLHGIPSWLEHTEAHEDGMGLADVVFPAFLFIVGLSIPFAIKARINKGDSIFRVWIHIIRRAFALIVMGFYMVNQNGFVAGSHLTEVLWEVFMIVAFILIWNHYDDKKFWGIPAWLLQFAGLVILIVLAWVYKGGSPEDPHWMRPQWWGILGIIGWAYLICATLYLLLMRRAWLIPLAWAGLYLLNLLEFIPAAEKIPSPLLVVNASGHALVMSGVLATQIYLLVRENQNRFIFPALLMIPAFILLIYGFAVRPQWGISKIMATPAWTAICAGISCIAFAIIHVITDIAGYTRWASVIMPAGRSTLTCYLLPGLVYPILWPLQQLLPDSMLAGGFGLIKSLLFALLIIVLTGLLEKIKIQLKI